MRRTDDILADSRIYSEELDSLIRSESSSKVLKKLYFIKFRCLGNSVRGAATQTRKTHNILQNKLNIESEVIFLYLFFAISVVKKLYLRLIK